MGAPELLAVSLGLSVVVAGLGWAGGRWVETVSGDPGLRERAWTAALLAPVLPPLLIGVLLLTPPPVREATPLAAAAGSAVALDMAPIGWGAIALAGGLALARFAALAARAARLDRLIRKGGDAGPVLSALVDDVAGDLNVAAPRTTESAEAAEPFLAGLGRPRLILPAGLADAPRPVARALIAHELGHLKRGDHRALWMEEALLAALAVNPLMRILRDRRAAAREEACDALALAGAAPEIRRAYAQTLIEALRRRAAPQDAGALPALTFTGAGRTTAMHRLKAVLAPPAPAGRRARLIAAAASLGMLTAVGGTTVALAGQREPEFRTPPAPAQTTVVDRAASVEVAGRMVPGQNPAFQTVERIPESARPGQVFRLRTPAGGEVEAWRGQASDRPGYVAPSGPVLQAWLGAPETPAGHVVVRGTLDAGAPASGQSQAAGTSATNGQTREVEITARGSRGRQAPPPPVALRDQIRPAQSGAPAREVEIVATRGAQSRRAPPPPALRPDQVRPARPAAPEREVVFVTANGTVTRQAPATPPALRPEQVRPARPGAPTSRPPVR